MHPGQTRESSDAIRYDVSRLTADDVYLLNEGSHFRLYDKLGAHLMTADDGAAGTHFAVVAPAADAVSVMGDFNNWDPEAHPLRQRKASGMWEGFIPGVAAGAPYKYRVRNRAKSFEADKADPYAFRQEPDGTASVVWGLDYDWGDSDWMAQRGGRSVTRAPMSIYEVHLGSWQREDGRMLTYRELADRLPDYVADMGFTHVELMPVMEHPFYGSWGYQTTGYFAPTIRYGPPEDFMALVDAFHRRGVAVILDWAPAHFPDDPHGLGRFDGTALYEHPDPKRGRHPDWGSYIFDYGRRQVQSFLFSSAFFWAEKYHADGFRVDAVSSMLYLSFSRRPGEWEPNKHGGPENLEAVDFLRRFNAELYDRYPDVQTFAEEATDWPGVSRPVHLGGLGFGYKWDMGWMNDTLDYFRQDPIYRKFHHGRLNFRAVYHHKENYVLPLSHDEVVHGKGSLLGRMPGDDWQKMANLRLLLGSQYLQPGKKLLFMGSEFGPWDEWSHDEALAWGLLAHGPHQGLREWVRDLNRFYREEPVLHTRDTGDEGFEWVDCCDADNSVLSFLRLGDEPGRYALAVMNYTPIPRDPYRLGVPVAGWWREALNSDAARYGGGDRGNLGGRHTDEQPSHGHAQSLALYLPPLSCVVLMNQ